MKNTSTKYENSLFAMLPYLCLSLHDSDMSFHAFVLPKLSFASFLAWPPVNLPQSCAPVLLSV